MSSSKLKVFSSGLRKRAFLDSFLSVELSSTNQLDSSAPSLVVGWGQKSNTRKARAYAAKHHLPFIALEDGFLRSVGLGVHGVAALSLVVDEVGIYYDSTQPSRLEQLIQQVATDDLTLQQQAEAALQYVVTHDLSKYNHSLPVDVPPLPAGLTSRVVVVDQTYGDMSVLLGGGEGYFPLMLQAALEENPTAQIIVKTHPDVLSGKKKGYLTDMALLQDPRVLLWAQDCSPLPFLRQVDQVYVYTSQMGFEALMLDKPVQCFGLPWYAGWGVTVDRHPQFAGLAQRRGGDKVLWQLFAAAYLQYARYIQPDTGSPGDIWDVMPWLVRNRDAAYQLQGTLYCVGMSFWKKATLKPFLRGHATSLRFVSSLQKLARMDLAADAKIIIWGSRQLLEAQALGQAKQCPVWRMEDGFVRSVGLGSDLYRPLSLVVDTSGMYYDPHSHSDLEQLLLTGNWSTTQCQQARRYQHDFVSKGLSKYNLGGSALQVNADGRTVILIPGQVEDDASVRYGSPVVRTNAALIQAVRSANPSAYLIYKPHPDVVAGNRQGQVDAALLAQQVDLVVTEANIVACLRIADQVHTMTSLTGFEALLHGKVVHCYGGPFYAGWGLTVDHYPLPHRQRQLLLDQLIYATIFQYPRYIMPPQVGVRGFAAPESVLAWLVAQRAKQQKVTSLTGWLVGIRRKIAALWQLFFHK